MNLKLVPNQTHAQTMQYVQALQLAANGSASKDIAAKLFKGTRTIEKWFWQLSELNNCKGRTHLVAEAIRQQIIN